MTDIHDIKPVYTSWWIYLFICISSILFFLITIWIVYKKIKRLKNSAVINTIKPVDIDQSKSEALNKLEILKKQLLKDESPNASNYYFELSKIIRTFIGIVKNIAALNMVKEDIYKIQISDLNNIIEECYIGEFSKNKDISKEMLLKLIDFSKNLVNKCN